MNILFITISHIANAAANSISLDLLHEFQRAGHDVHIVCALERKENMDTYLADEAGCKVLRVKTGNNKKANIIEKGITTVLLPSLYIKAIKQHFGDIKFDLVLYPTPPVTHYETVKYIKKRDGAKTYLLLKDIFPQNAVDIGMMRKSGVKGVLTSISVKRKRSSMPSPTGSAVCPRPMWIMYCDTTRRFPPIRSASAPMLLKFRM